MVRKWGFYITLLAYKTFKAKLLFFRKGKAISKQLHNYRSESWFILHGAGLMDCNGLFALSRGDNFSIPVQSVHQFAADRFTIVLEIQTGYCREEDIERL